MTKLVDLPMLRAQAEAGYVPVSEYIEKRKDMTEHYGKTKLAELVNGLECVTEGPWQRSGIRLKPGRIDVECFLVGPDTAEFIAILIEPKRRNKYGHAQAFREAAHIARCDPASIRSIAEYVAALEAENKRLRRLLDKAVNGPWQNYDLDAARKALETSHD